MENQNLDSCFLWVWEWLQRIKPPGIHHQHPEKSNGSVCVVRDPSLLPEAAGFKRALLIALISWSSQSCLLLQHISTLELMHILEAVNVKDYANKMMTLSCKNKHTQTNKWKTQKEKQTRWCLDWISPWILPWAGYLADRKLLVTHSVFRNMFISSRWIYESMHFKRWRRGKFYFWWKPGNYPEAGFHESQRQISVPEFIVPLSPVFSPWSAPSTVMLKGFLRSV